VGSPVKAGTRSAGCHEGDRKTRRSFRRIEGALANLDHHVARTTAANILTRNGINPALERGSRTSWRTFVGAHWSTIAAIEFRGRRVHFAGMTPGPDEAWIRQIGPHFTDPVDGFLR
jgi:hypothetical protein